MKSLTQTSETLEMLKALTVVVKRTAERVEGLAARLDQVEAAIDRMRTEVTASIAAISARTAATTDALPRRDAWRLALEFFGFSQKSRPPKRSPAHLEALERRTSYP